MAPSADELRVSDEQRDGAVEQLREHFTVGRLTEDELSDRVQAAYGAKTSGELQSLMNDLPALPLSPAQLRAARVERRRKVRRRAIEETSASFGAFGVCTLIWLASGAHGYFWPVWVAIAPVLAVFRNGPRLLGVSAHDDYDESGGVGELRRREARRARRGRRRGYWG
jgi:hypothetical protein